MVVESVDQMDKQSVVPMGYLMVALKAVHLAARTVVSMVA